MTTLANGLQGKYDGTFDSAAGGRFGREAIGSSRMGLLGSADSLYVIISIAAVAVGLVAGVWKAIDHLYSQRFNELKAKESQLRHQLDELKADRELAQSLSVNRATPDAPASDSADTEAGTADAARAKESDPEVVDTTAVYSTYARLTEEDELLAWVATWPAFRETDKETALLECRAGSIVIAGPLDNATQLPGIFWRMDIRRRRGQDPPSSFQILGRPLPAMKMIIAGRQSFLAPEAKARTPRYYYLGDTTDRLRTIFCEDLVGARMIEEEVYLFLLRHLEGLGGGTLRSSDLLNLFRQHLGSEGSSPDAREYDEEWVLEGMRKWIPECVSWVQKHRGWTALRLERLSRSEFALSLSGEGRLSGRHAFRLAQPSALVAWRQHGREDRLPRLRVVVTNSCSLGCSYCPPGNEDYRHGSEVLAMDASALRCVLEGAFHCGFRSFSVTGGEPLEPSGSGPDVMRVLPEFVDAHGNGLDIAVQTNGVHLQRCLPQLSQMKDCLHLKVSLDAIHPSPGIAKATVSETVVMAIDEARASGLSVGVDFVLTTESKAHLKEVAEWAWHAGVYLKILDLNWYEDLGHRRSGKGAQRDLPCADLFWQEQYVSPMAFYRQELEETFGPLRAQPLGLGIPVLETRPTPNGFFIRVKDSALGSHYSATCRICPLFVDKRRCQEGVYQPWVTPGLRMKLCRHRPDIHMDLAEPVQRGDIPEVGRRMRAFVNAHYTNVEHVALARSSSRSAAP